MQKCPRVGKTNEPIADQTKISWAIMSPGRESDLVSLLYTRTSVSDFDCLCDLDVLGVEKNHLSHDENVFKKIKEKTKVKIKKNSHRPVIRQNVESELRVVYDASSKSRSGYSLNDCLEKGPSLQNELGDILIRTRFEPVILCADIEKVFLQIRIKENERESLKFNWVEDLTNNTIQILRFTRLVFGLNQSPFILEGTLKTHFERYESMYLELIRKIRDDMYVDDLVTGGESLQEVEKIKSDSIELFEKGGFKLHKWHSNETNLETNDLNSEKELNFAKEHLGTKANETKILGLNWDKQRDKFRVEIPTERQYLQKANV